MLQGDFILSENSPRFELHDANCFMMLYAITAMAVRHHVNGITVRVAQTNEELIL